MDVTTASLQSWELLAQLATYGHTEAIDLHAAALLDRVAELLQRSLPCPWGLIVAIDANQVHTAAWGLDQAEQQRVLGANGQYANPHTVRFALQSGAEERGYLLLARPSDPGAMLEPAFGNALAAHIALLLDVQRRRLAERLARALQQLARAASAQPSLEDLLDFALNQLASVLPYDQASILLFEDDGGRRSTFAEPGSPLRLAATAQSAEPLRQPGLPSMSSQLYSEVIASGQPQVCTVADTLEILPCTATTGNALLVPLLIADEPIGLLAILGSPDAWYGYQERSAASAIADQVAQAISATRRFAQQHQRARELFVLFENSQVISTTTQLDSLLDRALENIALAMSADGCGIALLDPEDANRLSIVSFYGAEADDPIGTSYTVSEEWDLVALLASEGALAFEHTPEGDPQPDGPVASVLQSLGYNSGIVVPLRAKEHAIGLLGVGYKASDHAFGRSDLNLMETLANQVAAAVANAQLVAAEQRRTAELELLQSLTQQLNAELSIEETSEALTAAVRKLVPHSSLEICLYDPHTHTFEASRNDGPDVPLLHRTFLPDEGLTGWLARHRRALRLADASQRAPVQLAEKELAEAQPVRGYVGVPLQVGDELVGTLELASVRAGAFSERDERLLTIVGGQIAQALHNALRYEQADEHLRSRLQQLTAIQHVNSQLTMGHLLPDILSFVLEQARKATTASQGFIALFNTKPTTTWEPQTPGYIVIASSGYDQDTQPRLVDHQLPQGATTAQTALVSGEPELTDELTDEERAAVFSPEARSALAVPIFYEAQVAGVLTLLSPLLHGFDHDSIQFVSALGGQSALAIGNAQRYEDQVQLNAQLQRRAAILNNVLEIGQALRADRPIDEILEQVAYSIIEACGFRRVAFYLVDPDDSTMLRIVTGAGIPLNELEQMREVRNPVETALRCLHTRFRVGRGFFLTSAQIAEIGAGVDTAAFAVASDMQSGPLDEWQFDDMLLVPLYSLYGRELLGIVSVNDPINRKQPTMRAVDQLAIFADQAAIAIENVQLVRSAHDQAEQMKALSEERERRIAELDVINRIGNVTRSTLNVQQMLGQVYDCLADFLAVDAFYAVIYRSDSNEVVLAFMVDEGVQSVDDTATIPEPASMSGRIIQTRQPLLFEDLIRENADDELAPVTFGNTTRLSASWLGVPLLVGEGEVVGVISVQSYVPGLYGERELSLMSTVASQLALGVQNARLFIDRERRIAELDLVNRIGTITNSTLNLQQMLGQVYDCLAEFLTIDACCIFIYHTDSNTISLSFEIDEGERVVTVNERYPSTGSLTEHIIHTRQPLLFRNLHQERHGLGIQPHAFGNTERRSASWLGVPLLAGEGTVVGVLSVQSYTPGLYGERELSFMSTVASELALGVQNTRLFEERDRQIVELDALGRVGRVTSSALELLPITEGLYDVLSDAIAADVVSLTVYQPRRNVASLIVIDHTGVRWNVDRSLDDPTTDATLADRIRRTGTPLTVADVQPIWDELPALQQLYPHAEPRPRSYLGVPLLDIDGKPMGALGVFSWHLDAFGPRERAFLSSVVAQVSLGAQNVLLYTKSQEQVEQLSLLNHVSSAASSTLAREQIYQAALDAMAGATGVDHAELVMYDRPTGTATVAAQFTEWPNNKPLIFSLLQNPAVVWMDAHQRPLIVLDAQNDPLLASLHGLYRRLNIQSLMFVPLVVGGEVIGVVGLDCVGRTARFSDEQVELCQTIANQTAAAIENVRLFHEAQNNASAFQRKVDELSTLLDAARLLSSSLRPDEVLDYLMDLVRRQLDVHTVALWTVSSDGMLTPAAMDGIPPETGRTMHVPVGMGMTGQVAATSQPLIVADVEAYGQSLYPEFNRRNQLASFMGVPVIYRERTVGVLSVMTINRREFSADEMLLLVGLADQAAIALENARLFQQRERRINELTTLNHISDEMNATLELQSLLAALHAGIGDVIDVSTSAIGLYDPLQERMTFPIARVAGRPIVDDEPLTLDNPDSLIARVVLETRLLLLKTPQEIAALGPLPLERGLPNIGSYLGVPIMMGDDVLGAIILQSELPYAFDADDERFLVTVASQAATSIAKAHLFSEREQRLKEVTALKDIGSALSSTMDVQHMLEQLHRELGRVIDVSTALIGLYNPEQETLDLPVLYDQGVRIISPPQALADGPNAWVIHNQQPLLIETLDLGEQMGFELRRNAGREGPLDHFEESFLIVPIISGNDVLGVINVQSYQPYAFDADDLRFVSTAANQAAVAVANARLFAERGRRIEELATFNEIGQALSATVSLEELIDLIYRQTSRLLDTTNFYMALLDERSGKISFPLYIERGHNKDVAPLGGGNSLTEYVMRTREPLLLLGIDIEQQVAKLGISPKGDIPRSWLGVPMVSADKVIGMIGIQQYDDVAAYGQDDIRLLSTIASWASIALQNAQLIGAAQQSLEELTSLYQVSVDLAGTLETKEVQRIVVAAATRLLGVEMCAVTLLNDEQEGARGQMLQQVLVDSNGIGPDLHIAVRARGVTQEILQSDRPIVVPDLSQVRDPNPIVQQFGVRGVIGAAIGPQEERLGILWAGTSQPHEWSEREISLFSILANLAGQALTSAQLFQSELNRRQLADTLRDVAQSFTSTLALDEIQTLTLDQLAKVVPFDAAVVLLREEGSLYSTATRGYPNYNPDEPWIFPIEDTLIFKRMTEDRQPVLVADVLHDPLAADIMAAFSEYETTTATRCWIGAPLLVDDELVGVLAVGSETIGTYSADDAQDAFALASQASQAIQNARLFEQVSSIAAELEHSNSELERRVVERTADLEAEKQRLEAVHAITLELTSTLDLNEILGKALKMACQTVGAARGSIMLKDAQNGELVCRQVMVNESEVRPEHLPISFGVGGGGLAGWVMEHQEAVRIPDVRRDRRWIIETGRADEVRSVAAVPLMSNDVPLGVLVLTSPKVGFFSEPQLRLLATIANEVAIAVHNGELYTLINDFASRMGEALEREREEFSKTRAILQSVTEGVIVLDEDRRVVLFNPAAEQVLDISARAVRDHPLQNLADQGETANSRQRNSVIYDGLYVGLETAKDRHGIYSTKLELEEPDQTIAVNMAPVIGNDGRRYGDVAVLRDVTREIEADRAKREFISGVSHELRTPLTSIKGYVDLLLSGLLGPLTDAQNNSLTVVKTNSNRLMDLINDILMISSIEAGKIELILSQVHIINILNDVVQSLMLETERKSIKVTIAAADGLPTVTADKKRLTQVVFNLFSNAVKYTYEHGQIFVRAFLSPSGMLQVEVEDTGVGMTPEQMEKLFRPFYRADNPLREEAGGTGLGLSIAKSLVEQHGGELWPTSEQGKGSTFHFVIPLQQADVTSADRDTE